MDNKLVSLLIVKVSQRNFAFIILVFIWIFMEEAFASTVAIAVCAYFDPLSKIGAHKLQAIAIKLDRVISKSPSNNILG